jgi:hypothetical protein
MLIKSFREVIVENRVGYTLQIFPGIYSDTKKNFIVFMMNKSIYIKLYRNLKKEENYFCVCLNRESLFFL